ncbi:MAG: damage repair protein, partial [Bacilli bacterium]
VADRSRGMGSVVLAVSPHLKSLGAQSRCRIHDLQQFPDVIYAVPRMRSYMEFACQIYRVYLEFVAPEDIHIYSIDEAFLDITHYMNYYQWTSEQFASAILQKISLSVGLIATCGIGDNIFQAKVALDCFAKKSPNYIAMLTSDDFIKKTKDLHPINQIWGIGGRIQQRLHQLNIDCLGDIIKVGVNQLRDEFGIIGEELFDHAQGIDDTKVQDARNYIPQHQSFGHSQVMFEDYSISDMYTILMEYVDMIATELVMKRQQCQMISLGIGYSKDHQQGFNRQMKLSASTNSRSVLLEAFSKIYYQHVTNLPIRRIGVRVSSLSKEAYYQWNLFDDYIRQQKEHRLFDAMGHIQARYGMKAVNMSISYLPKATKIMRSRLIGGHNADA